MQDGDGTTSESFGESVEVIKIHRPRRLYGENVKHMDSATPTHEFISDGEYAKNELHQIGYWAESFIVSARDFGSHVVRHRWLLNGEEGIIK